MVWICDFIPWNLALTTTGGREGGSVAENSTNPYSGFVPKFIEGTTATATSDNIFFICAGPVQQHLKTVALLQICENEWIKRGKRCLYVSAPLLAQLVVAHSMDLRDAVLQSASNFVACSISEFDSIVLNDFDQIAVAHQRRISKDIQGALKGQVLAVASSTPDCIDMFADAKLVFLEESSGQSLRCWWQQQDQLLSQRIKENFEKELPANGRPLSIWRSRNDEKGLKRMLCLAAYLVQLVMDARDFPFAAVTRAGLEPLLQYSLKHVFDLQDIVAMREAASSGGEEMLNASSILEDLLTIFPEVFESWKLKDNLSLDDQVIYFHPDWRHILSSRWLCIECSDTSILRSLNPGSAAFAWTMPRYVTSPHWYPTLLCCCACTEVDWMRTRLHGGDAAASKAMEQLLDLEILTNDGGMIYVQWYLVALAAGGGASSRIVEVFRKLGNKVDVILSLLWGRCPDVAAAAVKELVKAGIAVDLSQQSVFEAPSNDSSTAAVVVHDLICSQDSDSLSLVRKLYSVACSRELDAKEWEEISEWAVDYVVRHEEVGVVMGLALGSMPRVGQAKVLQIIAVKWNEEGNRRVLMKLAMVLSWRWWRLVPLPTTQEVERAAVIANEMIHRMKENEAKAATLAASMGWEPTN